MTVVTLRPNATIVNAGSLVGAASAHAALSDDSDASYVELDPTYEVVQCNLADLTFPAGAAMVATRVRARVALLSGFSTTISLFAYAPATLNQQGSVLNVNWSAPLTVQSPVSGQPAMSDAEIDGAFVSIGNTNGGILRVYEAYVDAVYVVRPVVVVNTPTGAVTTTNQPLVSWTNTLDADGGPQVNARVHIFSAAQYGAGGFDPSTTPPTAVATLEDAGTSLTTPTALPDGTYRAYVQINQQLPLFTPTYIESDWAFSAFTIAVALPAVPTVTVTPEHVMGRHRIDIASNAGAATTDVLDLQRSLDGGTTWGSVRLPAGLVDRITASSATVYDYEAPNGAPTLYRARALHNYSGLYAASAWTVGAIVNLLSNPSAEISETDGGTQASNATLARSTTYASHGVASFRLTATGAFAAVFNGGLRFPVVAGHPYSAGAEYRTAGTQRLVVTVLIFYDAGGAVLSQVNGTQASEVAGTFTRSVVENAVAPVGAVTAIVAAYIVNSASGDVHYVDGMIATQDTVCPAYRDGDSTGYGWQGTPHNSVTGSYIAATWSTEQWWLKHPNLPALNVPVELVVYGPVSRTARQGVWQAVGALLPVVISDTPGGARGATALRTTSTAERDDLETLLATAGVLMLQGPASHGEPDRYIAPGDLTIVRLIDNGAFQIRDWSLPWTEVAKPPGGTS